MTISVFVGVSVDGFMARPDGNLDWLPEGGGEPHGYDEFIASVDAIVIGRHTFEKVLTFGSWPYGNKRVVVLSSHPVDLSAVKGGVVEWMGLRSRSPRDLRQRARITCMSTVASPSSGSCATGWSSGW
jgi:dihydrofolate reductase